MLLSRRHNVIFLEILQRAKGEMIACWLSLTPFSHTVRLFEHLTLGWTQTHDAGNRARARKNLFRASGEGRRSFKMTSRQD